MNILATTKLSSKGQTLKEFDNLTSKVRQEVKKAKINKLSVKMAIKEARES